LPSGAEVTRVAPSPTGRPHIGTALQALIDRALADKTKGVFILRIEDTDRQRLDVGAIDEILAALEWLNLSPDEGPHVGGRYAPYTQSERLPLYQAAAQWLVKQGYAYHCFCSHERLERVRKEQQAKGQLPMYDRFCRGLDPAEVERRLAMGERSVIRMIVPEDRTISFDDPLRGKIAFHSSQLDDQVLLKSDGFPTYHLAVVVDDHFMRVTTAVRGEEWISSTPKHLLLYEYFGWQPPRIVHTPLLRDTQRRKLSKRSGDTSVEWFQLQGYLPDGLRNFLSRIIWAHPEEKDVYPYEEFVRFFSVEQLSKSAPIVDLNLLDFINNQYMRELTPEEVYGAVVELFGRILASGREVSFEEGAKSGRVQHPVSREELQRFLEAFTDDPDYTRRVLEVEPERFKKLSDVMLQYSFFFPQLFRAPSAEALSKQLGSAEAASAMIRTFMMRYDENDDHEQWEGKIREQAAEAGVKAGKLFMTIRLALTGSDRTPPLYDIMRTLGREEVERRLRLALDTLALAKV